ncbi:MAG: hypothetical protein WCT32_00605 [Patescibacteria group bacterium]|jgi:hypothetical protein
MPKRFALAFAHSGSVMFQWEPGQKPVKHEFTLSDGERILSPEEVVISGGLLFDLLQKGDVLFTEMGGRNGPFCLQALSRGVVIHQIPTYRLIEILGENNDEEEDSGRDGISLKREARARLIMELAGSDPGQFYPMLPIDPLVWRIQTYINTYVSLQKDDRIKATLRRHGRQADFAWLPDSTDKKEIEATRDLLARPRDIEYYLELEGQMMKGIERLLPSIPIWNEFFGPIKGIGPSLAGRLIGVIRDIRRFPKRDGFRAYLACAVTPEGMAPRYIRKKKDGSRGVTYNQQGKSTLFKLVSDQVVRQGSRCCYNIWYLRAKCHYSVRQVRKLVEDGVANGDSPAVQAVISQLDAGRSLESKINVVQGALADLSHLLDAHPTLRRKMGLAHIEARARRKAISRFVDELWVAWWRIIEREYKTQGIQLPDSVRQVLHPVDPHVVVRP